MGHQCSVERKRADEPRIDVEATCRRLRKSDEILRPGEEEMDTSVR